MTVAQDGLDGGTTARRLDDAHRQLLADESIQFELPTAIDNAPSRQQPSAGDGPVVGPPQAPRPDPASQVDPSAAPPPMAAPDPAIGRSEGLDALMQAFLWIAAALALAILVYWLFTFVRDRRPGGREAGAGRTRPARTEVWRPGEDEAVTLLEEADLLAGEGRFDEAARLLLHRSIAEIHANRPDLVRPALTSRDIAAHPLLPAGPAAAFARIAALVERSLFARRPLGRDDWQACRAAWREFAFAEGWQG